MVPKLRRIVLFVVGGLLIAGILLIAFNAELRGMLLLIVAPQYFRETVFLRFANDTGQDVYLLGTIHSNHQSTKDYSLLHLQAVLEHLKPDLLLVESRPDELARDNWGDGPIEMPFASLTARAKGVEVQGMDWWVMNDNHQTNSKERENRMFQNILTSLPGHHTVLILTGFSHVEGFRRRFLASGYRQITFSSSEKQALFDTSNETLIFPHGMTYYIQKRIEIDQLELQSVTDNFWRDRIADGIALRQRFLKTIATVGERQQ
jgi:hypothetical protein